MFLFQKLEKAAKDESGAVTVDWVMLTAAMMGAAVAMTTTIDGGLKSVAEDINNAMRLENVQGIVEGED